MPWFTEREQKRVRLARLSTWMHEAESLGAFTRVERESGMPKKTSAVAITMDGLARLGSQPAVLVLVVWFVLKF